MKMISDSIVLDWRELQLKWAVDDTCKAVEALIPLIEKIKDPELLQAINDYLQAVHDYVVTVERVRQSLAPHPLEAEL